MIKPHTGDCTANSCLGQLWTVNVSCISGFLIWKYRGSHQELLNEELYLSTACAGDLKIQGQYLNRSSCLDYLFRGRMTSRISIQLRSLCFYICPTSLTVYKMLVSMSIPFHYVYMKSVSGMPLYCCTYLYSPFKIFIIQFSITNSVNFIWCICFQFRNSLVRTRGGISTVIIIKSAMCHRECAQLNLDCALLTLDFTLLTLDCALLPLDCVLLTLDCALLSPDCALLTLDCALLTLDCALLSMDSALLTLDCGLLTLYFYSVCR